MLECPHGSLAVFYVEQVALNRHEEYFKDNAWDVYLTADRSVSTGISGLSSDNVAFSLRGGRRRDSMPQEEEAHLFRCRLDWFVLFSGQLPDFTTIGRSFHNFLRTIVA